MGIFSGWRERRRILNAPFPDAWRAILTKNVVHWRHLGESERDDAEDLVKNLVACKQWTSARGFVITDEVRVTVAGQAALLVLGFPGYDYPNVRIIVVHSTTIRVHGENQGILPGTRSEAELAMLGAADPYGTVYLAWDELLANARHPERGHNLVYHEFAHALDRVDGATDGVPPMDNEQRARWETVFNREYELLQQGVDDELLRSYAGVDLAEFFAVATEVFFDRPVELQAHKPELYDVMRDFYRQDPATRVGVIPPS